MFYQKDKIMENDKQKHIDAILLLLVGLPYELVDEILTEATYKARKQSVLTVSQPNP